MNNLLKLTAKDEEILNYFKTDEVQPSNVISSDTVLVPKKQYLELKLLYCLAMRDYCSFASLLEMHWMSDKIFVNWFNLTNDILTIRKYLGKFES